MPTQREIVSLRNKISQLPALVKFELYEELRRDLISFMSTETTETRRIREAQEALTAIETAAKETGLEDGEKLAAKKFDAVSRRMGLGWSSAKIIRLYGSWRLAIAAYRGDRYTPGVLLVPSLRRRGTGRHVSDNHNFDGIRHWLETKPPKKTLAAYNQWAGGQNARLSEQEEPLMRANSICARYRLRWPTVLETAEGTLTLDQAQEQTAAEVFTRKRGADLIGAKGISRFLGLSSSVIFKRRMNDRNFPVAVAEIRTSSAWLMSDLRLYKRGLPTPDRTEGEDQADYMDLAEIRDRLGKAIGTVKEHLQNGRWDLLPKPDGYLGVGVPYWKRAKAEKWLKKHGFNS